jgi:tRNA(Arg) A34 adenosine deaminase TadA
VAEPTDADARLLRRAFALAREAREEGNHPFACLLAGPDGEVVLESKNAAGGEHVNRTAHAETLLARAAAERFTYEELRGYTLVTSAEPCAMCAGTMYWAGIGRLVFGMTERELKGITGDHPENPTLDLPCREVFARGQLDIEVVGPALVEEARAVHDGYWERSPA